MKKKVKLTKLEKSRGYCIFDKKDLKSPATTKKVLELTNTLKGER